MNDRPIRKLNHVVHDVSSGSIFIALRPKSLRKPAATLEHSGRTLLDLDAEGDVYGVRLLGVKAEEAEKILELLKAR